jgi:hypothetical protein
MADAGRASAVSFSPAYRGPSERAPTRRTIRGLYHRWQRPTSHGWRRVLGSAPGKEPVQSRATVPLPDIGVAINGLDHERGRRQIAGPPERLDGSADFVRRELPPAARHPTTYDSGGSLIDALRNWVRSASTGKKGFSSATRRRLNGRAFTTCRAACSRIQAGAFACRYSLSSSSVITAIIA